MTYFIFLYGIIVRSHIRMKAATLYNVDTISIEDIPIPERGATDALMKTKACGICSGDVMQWYIENKAPLVLGHEPVGEIVEIDQSHPSFRQGDRVFTHHHAPCLLCRFCKRGSYVQCETWKRSRIVPGGISEYVLIPSVNLTHDTIRLSSDISDEDGTLIEPIACSVKGFRKAQPMQGDTVLVIGLGVMGMIHILLARAYGAGRIIGADRVAYRLNKALELGADNVINVSHYTISAALQDITEGDRADLVIVGPNSVDAMIQGIDCVRPGGKVLFFTPAKPGEMLTIDPNYLYFNDIDIVTSYSCGPPDTLHAHDLVRERVVTAEKLVTHRFPIEKTQEAFSLTARAQDSLKVVILFD